LLTVVVHNSAWIATSDDSLALKLVHAITATGWAGVQLFFVLSGFLITDILLRAKGGPDYFRTFFIRRTLRIFPLYYAYLAVAFFVFPLIATAKWIDTATANQWWFWTYLANWATPLGRGIPGLSHLWSLAVEEQFYFVWPFVVIWLPIGRLRGLCAALVLLTPLIRLGLVTSGLPSLTAYEFTIARWDALAIGAWMACMLAEPATRPRLALMFRPALLLSLGGLVGMTLWLRGFHQDETPVLVLGQSLVALASAALVYAAAVSPSSGEKWWLRLRSMLSMSWLRDVGTYSYGMYVLHFPIQFLLMDHLRPFVNGSEDGLRVLRLLCYLAGIVLLSYAAARLSWLLIERPALQLKERLAPRLH
jgi:peptidoglycan/LPS O-acetylase OafA/YrhL